MSVKQRRLFWSLAVLAICTLIYFLSGQNGEDSTITSGFFSRLLEPLFGSWASLITRKGAHFTIYLLLGISAFQTARAWLVSSSAVWVFCAALCFCFAYAAADEYHQTFVAERSGQFSDVLLDTSGAFCGITGISIASKKRFLQN